MKQNECMMFCDTSVETVHTGSTEKVRNSKFASGQVLHGCKKQDKETSQRKVLSHLAARSAERTFHSCHIACHCF